MHYKVLLAGNPNVGKTSLFNRITKSQEHVGNWHGVTVDKKVKTVAFSDDTVSFTDLPGLYSLNAVGLDEEVALGAIDAFDYDAVVYVAEGAALRRNMYLCLQLLERGVPVFFVVNMADELSKKGLKADTQLLSLRLGIPVVSCSAKLGGNTSDFDAELIKYLKAAKRKPVDKNKKLPSYLSTLPIQTAAALVKTDAEKAGIPVEYAALKVLERDEYTEQCLKLGENQKKSIAALGDTVKTVVSLRYNYIDNIIKGVIVPDETQKKKPRSHKNCSKPQKSAADKHGFRHPADKIFLNKYAALPVFFLIMGLIFYLTFGVAGKFFSETLSLAFKSFVYNPLLFALSEVDCPAFLRGLILDGAISGVVGVLVFLPQVVLLFFFLGLLEDSGYISRVAFMTDGFFQKIGLSGRAVFTMFMGLGCSATAVMTARTLDDENMRKKTVILTPFLSCSARLPIFTVLCGAFFAPYKPFLIIAMYMLGALAAVLLAAIFERTKLKSGEQNFLMEMPPYRMPTLERVLSLIGSSIKNFIVRIGTVIFLLNVIVWILSNVSVTKGFTDGTYYKSILETFAGVVAPVFSPLGFGSWKAVTALLSGVVAKEAVISTIQSFGGAESVFTGSYAHLSALSFMIFSLLYVPCIATMSSIKRETGIKMMLLSLVIHFTVAYSASLVVYWFGRLFYYSIGLFIGILAAALILIRMCFIVKKICAKKRFGECGYCRKCDIVCGKDLPKK